MNPGDETRQIFTRVLDLMLKAGWLHHHTYTEGKGLTTVWTDLGNQRVWDFIRIIKENSLDETDASPGVFDKHAHGERLPVGNIYLGETPAELIEAWRRGVAELGLHGDDEGLHAMVHIIAAWKPV